MAADCGDMVLRLFESGGDLDRGFGFRPLSGIESLTVDGTSSGGVGAYAANIDMEGVHDCWVKSIKSINGHTSHVCIAYGFDRCEVRDSYFYGTQAAAEMSYGVTTVWGSGMLCENNIFEKVVAGMLPGSSTSVSVWAYNYATNDWYTVSANYLMAAMQPHDAHCYMNLFEGNHCPKYDGDFIHGSQSHEVLFRNRITGYESYSYSSGPTVNNLACVSVQITNRYCLSIGNLLGTSGIYSHYQSYANKRLAQPVIYEIGLENQNYGKGWGDDTQTGRRFTGTWITRW